MLKRIYRLLILCICIVRYALKGRANKKITNPKIFLIVPSGKLGDVVCTTPIYYAIKKKYPSANVFVYGNRLNKEILENTGLFDYYIIRENFFADIVKIKKKKIDFACITGSGFLDLAMLYLSGIPLISAPIINKKKYIQETKPYKILTNCVVQTKFTPGQYMPRQYLYLLEPINIYSDDTNKHLGFTDAASQKLQQFYQDNGIDIKKDFVVGITPSAGNKIKLWGAKKFAKLADYIFEKYKAKIIIFGNKNDKYETEEMIKHLNKKTFFINSTGMFNIDELKAAISMINIFISVDTGPIYIAESFNIPTIDIVGPVDENDQPPIGKFHKIVKSELRKKPAMNALNARNYEYSEARHQVNDISIDMVIAKVNELISLLKI